MSSDLLPAELQELIPQQNAAKEFVGASESSFIGVPTLKFLSSSSEIVKSGEAPANSFQIQSKDNVKNLGKEVDALLICVRATAMGLNGDSYEFDHDPDSEKFAAVMKKADDNTKDAQGNKINKGFAYGPEVLVYLPESNSLATFWASSISARNEARDVLAKNMGKAVRFSNRQIKPKNGNKYYIFTATESSVPITIPSEKMEEVKNVITQFLKK